MLYVGLYLLYIGACGVVCVCVKSGTRRGCGDKMFADQKRADGSSLFRKDLLMTVLCVLRTAHITPRRGANHGRAVTMDVPERWIFRAYQRICDK